MSAALPLYDIPSPMLPLPVPPGGRAHITAITSGKGGVGKTF